MPGYVEGKDKNEILNALAGTAQPGSAVDEQQKMGIVVRCTEDLRRPAAAQREMLDSGISHDIPTRASV